MAGSGQDIMEGGVFMDKIFDFSEIERSEKSIRKTWSEFRDAFDARIKTGLVKWKN